MIFNTLHKTNGSKKVKNHLGMHDSFTSLCGRTQVENTGGTVKIQNRKWYSEGTINGDFSLPISEYEVRDSYCTYCVAIAYCKEMESVKTQQL